MNRNQKSGKTQCKYCDRVIRFPERLRGKKAKCKFCGEVQILSGPAPDDSEEKPSSVGNAPSPVADSSEQEAGKTTCVYCEELIKFPGRLRGKKAKCKYCGKVQILPSSPADDTEEEPPPSPTPDRSPKPDRESEEDHTEHKPDAPPPDQGREEPNSDDDREEFSPDQTPKDSKDRWDVYDSESKQDTYQSVVSNLKEYQADRGLRSGESNNRILWVIPWPRARSVQVLVFTFLLTVSVLAGGSYVLFNREKPNPVDVSSRNRNDVPAPSSSTKSEEQTNTDLPPIESEETSCFVQKNKERKQLTRTITSFLSLKENPEQVLFQFPGSTRTETLVKGFQRSWRRYYTDPLGNPPPGEYFPPPGTHTSTPDLWMASFGKIAGISSLDKFTRMVALYRLHQRMLLAKQRLNKVSPFVRDPLPWPFLTLNSSIRSAFQSLIHIAKNSSSAIVSGYSRHILRNLLLKEGNKESGSYGSIWLIWLFADQIPEDQWNQIGLTRGQITRRMQKYRGNDRYQNAFFHSKSTGNPGNQKKLWKIMMSVSRKKQQVQFLLDQLTRTPSNKTDPYLNQIRYIISLPGWSPPAREKIRSRILQALKRRSGRKNQSKLEHIHTGLFFSVMQGDMNLYKSLRGLLHQNPWAISDRWRKAILRRFPGQTLVKGNHFVPSNSLNETQFSMLFQQPDQLVKTSSRILNTAYKTRVPNWPAGGQIKASLWTYLICPKSFSLKKLLSIGVRGVHSASNQIPQLVLRKILLMVLHSEKAVLPELLKWYLVQMKNVSGNKNTDPEPPQNRPPSIRKSSDDSSPPQIIRSQQQQRYAQQLVVKSLLVQEHTTRGIVPKILKQLRKKAKQNQQISRDQLDTLENRLYRAYRSYYPMQFQSSVSERKQQELSEEQRNDSQLYSNQLWTSGQTGLRWNKRLENILESPQIQEKTETILPVFLLQPLEAGTLFKTKNDMLPPVVNKNLRKAHNFFRLLSFYLQQTESNSVQVEQMTQVKHQQIKPGMPYPDARKTHPPFSKETTLRTVAWAIKLQNQIFRIEVELLSYPSNQSPSEKQHKIYRISIAGKQ